MARSANNVLTRNYSGKVAGQYSLRMRGDQSIIAGLPKARKEKSNSEKVMAVKRKFALAIIYGKKAIANPELKAAYQAIAKKNQTAFNAAVLDALKGPELADLRTDGYSGAAGHSLIVQATDNFRVTKVSFGLFTLDGSLLEEGDAVMDENGFDWIYTTQSEIPSPTGTIIRVTAEDLPKNRTQLEAVI
ncbi:MAG: hypothetical protein JNK20_10045 [Flavipsychrobacter sp.]|nr:hypothetical protein [Flavipsychrobacter sp.]